MSHRDAPNISDADPPLHGTHVRAALRVPAPSRPMSLRNPDADAFVDARRNVPTSPEGGWALDMGFLAA